MALLLCTIFLRNGLACFHTKGGFRLPNTSAQHRYTTVARAPLDRTHSSRFSFVVEEEEEEEEEIGLIGGHLSSSEEKKGSLYTLTSISCLDFFKIRQYFSKATTRRRTLSFLYITEQHFYFVAVLECVSFSPVFFLSNFPVTCFPLRGRRCSKGDWKAIVYVASCYSTFLVRRIPRACVWRCVCVAEKCEDWFLYLSLERQIAFLVGEIFFDLDYFRFVVEKANMFGNWACVSEIVSRWLLIFSSYRKRALVSDTYIRYNYNKPLIQKASDARDLPLFPF